MILRLENITAKAHPCGNRIDLRWFNPEPEHYPYVRIIRREATYPTSADDPVFVKEENSFLCEIDLSFQNDLNNEEVTPNLRQIFFLNSITLSRNATVSVKASGSTWKICDGDRKYVIKKDNTMLAVYFEGPYSVEDLNLKGEIIYYYTLFPYKDTVPDTFDPYNRISAMASSSYNMAGQMYDLLPLIYHRYDTHEQLRRFLEIPGSLLDQLISFTRALLDMHNLHKVEGSLLPLLAQWIGWQLDRRLEIENQRNELRSAPYIYRTVGIIPTIEATVKRIIGWGCHTKEFVHNIFLTNTPSRLNIWARMRDADGEWLKPDAAISPTPLSLDFAYEGRPSAIQGDDGTLWLFYHTHKRRYDIFDKKRKDTWDIWYKTYRKNEGWSPSRSLTNKITLDRHPTAAVHDGSVWLFWDTDERSERIWRINYRRMEGGQWSDSKNFHVLEGIPTWDILHSWSEEYSDHGSVDFTQEPVDTRFRTWHIEVERRMPWATTDSDGGLWLFWLEKVQDQAQWHLKYNRHNGTRWELEHSGSFPLAEGKDPRVERDLFVLFRPVQSLNDESIYVFWVRRTAFNGPWEIVYRIKPNIDPKDSEWSQIYVLPKEKADDNDREPAAYLTNNGEIELFWSSNQHESYSLWHGLLADLEHYGKSERKQIPCNPYSQRTPMPISIDEDTLLIYRSNESLDYTSETYKATKTVDFRYTGCLTGDNRNTTKNSLKGKLEEFQTYTYDTGHEGKRTNDNKYSRDTVGIYLDPETEETKQIIQNQSLVDAVLRKFMPAQARAVFIINPPVYPEVVYTAGDPEKDIREEFLDTLQLSTAADYTGMSESHRDVALDWLWLHSWSEEYAGQHSVNFAATPIETRFRTWHIALEEGG